MSNQISEKKNKNKKICNNSDKLISYSIGIAGVAASVFSAIKEEDKGFFVGFVSSLTVQVILVILLIYVSVKIFQQANKEKQLEDSIEQLNKKREDIQEFSKTISLSIKNNSIHNNELLVKVPSIGDNSYLVSDLTTSSNMEDEKKLSILMNDASDYENRMFEAYKRYCADMLGEVVKLETAYLGSKGYDMKVSSTIKLLDKVYIHCLDKRTDVNVYTAFRDGNTYNDKNENGFSKREIGNRLYSIDRNSAFSECLSQDIFFRNNVTNKDNSYLNQNEEFYKYYNCTIVVPIRTMREDGKIKYLGYLCCDCLNTKEDSNDIIFDQTAAQYLFAFAQNLATFIETLDNNWVDRFKNHSLPGFPANAIEMIYKNTVHIERKG